MQSDDILGYDFQGWPIYKLTLREILTGLGGIVVDGKWEFNPEIMDVYPVTLEDDGMGYGINEMFISEASFGKDANGKYYINLFRDDKQRVPGDTEVIS